MNYEVRQEQVQSVKRTFLLLFSSRLMLSRQECKPGITVCTVNPVAVSETTPMLWLYTTLRIYTELSNTVTIGQVEGNMIKHSGIRVPVWSIVLQLLGWMLLKIRIASKTVSNKSCSELNFVKKVHEHLCLSRPGVELGDLKDWQVWSIILMGKS